MMSGGEYAIPRCGSISSAQNGRRSNSSLTFAIRSSSVGAGASTADVPTSHNGPVSCDVGGATSHGVDASHDVGGATSHGVDASHDVGRVPPVAAPVSNGATAHEMGGVRLREVGIAPDEVGRRGTLHKGREEGNIA